MYITVTAPDVRFPAYNLAHDQGTGEALLSHQPSELQATLL